MSVQETFIANLKYYRKKQKLSQKDLSIYLDKSYNYINCIEGGTSFPTPKVIDQIAEILKIDPVQLFDKNGSPESFKRFNKDEYIEEMADKLFNRIKTFVAEEIRNTLEESLSNDGCCGTAVGCLW